MGLQAYYVVALFGQRRVVSMESTQNSTYRHM